MRATTRAGFDSSTTANAPLKLFRAIFSEGTPLSPVGAAHTKQLSLILT
jgi:hypothetical protein